MSVQANDDDREVNGSESRVKDEEEQSGTPLASPDDLATHNIVVHIISTMINYIYQSSTVAPLLVKKDTIIIPLCAYYFLFILLHLCMQLPT